MLDSNHVRTTIALPFSLVSLRNVLNSSLQRYCSFYILPAILCRYSYDVGPTFESPSRAVSSGLNVTGSIADESRRKVFRKQMFDALISLYTIPL